MLTLQLLVCTLIGVFVILLPSAALAQIYRHNDMLREAEVATGSSSSYELSASPAAPLPNAPAPQKKSVIDKKFIAVMVGLGGAESVRIATHKLVLDHELAAGAPWVTSVPPNSHVVFKFSGIYAAELLAAYELKNRTPGCPAIEQYEKCGGCIPPQWRRPCGQCHPQHAHAAASVRSERVPIAVCE